jgi:hypothetical protein
MRRTCWPNWVSNTAFSDGGAGGAFGAGVLAGLTENGARPQPSVVTGASAGALIAPFLQPARVFAVCPARELVRLSFPHFTLAKFTIQFFSDATS